MIANSNLPEEENNKVDQKQSETKFNPEKKMNPCLARENKQKATLIKEFVANLKENLLQQRRIETRFAKGLP